MDELLGERPDAIRAAVARAVYSEVLEEGKAYYLDKTPGYFWITDFLLRIFPTAKYLTLLRNPLAIAASFKSTWGVKLDPEHLYENSDIMLFQLFTSIERVAAFARARKGDEPDSIVHYEELAFQPDVVVRRLLDYLNIPSPNDVSAFKTVDPGGLSRSGFGDRKILETKAIHRNSLNSWSEILTDIEAGLVSCYFDLDGAGMEALKRTPGAAAAAQGLRRFLTERLAERRSDYRFLLSYDAYGNEFNAALNGLIG